MIGLIGLEPCEAQLREEAGEAVADGLFAFAGGFLAVFARSLGSERGERFSSSSPEPLLGRSRRRRGCWAQRPAACRQGLSTRTISPSTDASRCSGRAGRLAGGRGRTRRREGERSAIAGISSLAQAAGGGDLAGDADPLWLAVEADHLGACGGCGRIVRPQWPTPEPTSSTDRARIKCRRLVQIVF